MDLIRYKMDALGFHLGLILLLNVPSVIATAQITADCGNKVYPGQAQLLTCSIKGSIEHGINWYRGTEQDPIVTCFQDRSCTSINDTKYSIRTNPHTSNLQQIQVYPVDKADFVVPWSCYDGSGKPDEFPAASTCHIVEKKEGTTTATCGNAHVGESKILRCEADRILKEIVWFRGNDIIVRCDTNGQCRPHSTTNYNGLDSQRMRINSVSEDDIKQKWACLDGDIYHEVPDKSTCKMKRVYSTNIISNCGLNAEVGKPHVLTCSIVGGLVNGVTWFRGNKAVIRCNPDLNCFPESPDYRESVPDDKGSVKLLIVKLTEEDKQQIWTCIDDDKLPAYELPTEVQCKIDETSNISKASACFAVDMKSLVILFCAVTFLIR